MLSKHRYNKRRDIDFPKLQLIPLNFDLRKRHGHTNSYICHSMKQTIDSRCRFGIVCVCVRVCSFPATILSFSYLIICIDEQTKLQSWHIKINGNECTLYNDHIALACICLLYATTQINSQILLDRISESII